MKTLYDPYILFPVLALCIGLILMFHLWRYRNNRQALTLFVLMFALAWWSLAAVLERISLDLPIKIFWMQMTYFGIVTIPVAWLIFTMQYTNRGKWLKPRNILLLTIVPVITLGIVWSNNLHHLMWGEIWLDSSLSPPADAVTHNVWFLINAIYAYSLLFLGTLYLLISFRRSTGIYRKQLGIMLIAACVPWLSNFLFISGIWSFSVIDPTPLAFSVTGIAFFAGFSRFHLLDVMPIAYGTIFKNLTNGVIVLNLQMIIIDLNPEAQHILGNTRQDVIERSLISVIPAFTDKLVKITVNDKIHTELSINRDQEQHHYAVSISPILDRKHNKGYVILLDDDTELRKAEEEAKQRVILEIELKERKRINEELSRSEYKFKELFNNISSCVAVYEAVNGGNNFIFKDFNQTAEKIEKIKKDEVVGKLVTGIFPGVAEMGLFDVLKRVYKTGVPEYFPVSLYQDNRISGWRENYVYKLPTGEIVAVYNDITAKKQGEEKLRESEEKYRTLYETMSQGVIYFDANGNPISFNPAAKKILGIDTELVLKNNSRDLNLFTIHEDGSEFTLDTHPSIVSLQTGKPVLDINMGILHPVDKKYRWVNVNAIPLFHPEENQPYQVYVTLEDITDHKLFEEELQEANKLFSTVANASTALVWMSGIDKSCTWFNKPWLEFTGRTLEQESGNGWIQGIHLDDIEFCLKTYNRAFDKRQPFAIEYRLRHHSGDYRWVFDQGTPRYDTKGEFIGYIGSVLDISEIKKSEEQLKLQAQILDAQMDAVFVHDEDGNIIYVNKAALISTGYTTEEFIGMNIGQIDTPEMADAIPSRKSYLAKHGFNSFETIHRSKNGVLSPFEIHTISSKWQGQNIIVSVARDITERKKYEVEKEQNTRFLQELIDSIPLPVFYKDTNGVYLGCNKYFTNFKGIKKEDFIGKNAYQIAPEKLADIYSQKDKELINNSGTQIYESEVKDNYGNIHSVIFHKAVFHNRDGSVGGLVGAILDITERKKTEESLRQSEEKLRLMFDSVTDGIVVSDLAGNLVQVNEADVLMHGYSSKEEIIGRPAFEFFTERERPTVALTLQKVFEQGRISNLEYHFIRKDGSEFPVEISCSVLKDSSGNAFGIIGIIKDITKRKLAEQTLRESEERLRAVVVNAPIGIATSGRDRYFLSANEAFCKILGYSETELRKMNFTDITYLEDIDQSQVFMADLDAGKISSFEQEKRYVKKDGTVIFGKVMVSTVRNPQGEILLYVAELEDITERKQSERKLLQAAEEWRNTFDSISEMVCILDNDYRLLRVNKAFTSVLSKNPRELLGKHCYELLHGTDEPRLNCPHYRTMQTGKIASDEFFEPYLGIFLETTTSPLFNDRGEVIGSVHVCRDVSSRKNMEQQLMLTDRLASIGELASGIAHELNNPLTSVIGFSQLLSERILPDDIKEDLSIINSEAQRAANIIKNLLTFARKHNPFKQPIKIYDVLETVLKIRAYEQKVHNITIIKQFAADLPEIMADQYQMQQVFINLLINAEFFMIEAHNRGNLTITAEKTGDSVRITFTDDGPGISPDNLKKLFNPFFTTKEVGKGTGLGLSICHGIVTSHGGKIYAKSDFGRGATFVIELPIKGEGAINTFSK